MKKRNDNKYWETEKSKTVKFRNNFIRRYDEAGKLQFGQNFKDKNGEEKEAVKFVIDRNDLFENAEGYKFLAQTLEGWKKIFNGEQHEQD